MQRGVKPQPTALKLVLGNPGKRPLNGAEPRPKGIIPDAPQDLSDEARIEWDRVSVQLDHMGLLTSVDRAALAGYCDAWGRWVYARRLIVMAAAEFPKYGGLIILSAKNNPMTNPAVGIANKAMQDVIHYAEQFGMTPSARSRIAATPRAPTEDEAEQFFN